MARVLRTLKVGRGADCDITLGDSTVSRRHASLELNPDGSIAIIDLGSANGTFVKAGQRWKRVDKATVRRDQPIRFGTLEVIPRDLLDALDRVVLVGDVKGRTSDRQSRLPQSPVKISEARERELLNRPRRNPETGDIEESN